MKRCCMVLLVLVLLLWPTQALAVAPVGDGQYTIEVVLSGGSGRASITSPTTLNVAGGAMTAIIEWSSPYYEYMLVEGIHPLFKKVRQFFIENFPDYRENPYLAGWSKRELRRMQGVVYGNLFITVCGYRFRQLVRKVITKVAPSLVPSLRNVGR